eukprot:scaffold66238_cov43-Cyclotella_meneghiniana.AAC.4
MQHSFSKSHVGIIDTLVPVQPLIAISVNGFKSASPVRETASRCQKEFMITYNGTQATIVQFNPFMVLKQYKCEVAQEKHSASQCRCHDVSIASTVWCSGACIAGSPSRAVRCQDLSIPPVTTYGHLNSNVSPPSIDHLVMTIVPQEYIYSVRTDASRVEPISRRGVCPASLHITIVAAASPDPFHTNIHVDYVKTCISKAGQSICIRDRPGSNHEYKYFGRIILSDRRVIQVLMPVT